MTRNTPAMDPKSTVLKSKSSNSAISKKSEEVSKRQYNKKTRSNANFSCHSLKKRGVYVEKRLTKTNLINNGNDDSIPQKPPPRPRPGQKKFLASVLSILSKSTTGTQYPEAEERKSRDKDKDILKQKNVNDVEAVAKESELKKRKEKFKSRILNRKFVREDKKKMVVLQSRKEIAQTPSNYSEWSYKDASQNSNVSSLMIYEDSNNNGGINIADELKNAVLEGRSAKVKRLRYLEDEPKTLVADGPKGQKNLYNFFVDLLETTISVYNVKAEYDAAGPSDASKTNLQIDESVANKLNVGNIKKSVEFVEGTVSPQNRHYLQNDAEYERNFVNSKPFNIVPFKREEPIKTIKVRKMKTDSFLYSNNTKVMPQKSKSVEIKHKTTFKNKNDLINVLKQQLEIDSNTFEEPKSIFQALRVMARNKKKISFDPSIDYKNFTDECILKRRKVISSRKARKNTNAIDDCAVKNIVRPVKSFFNKTGYIENTRKPNVDVDRNDNTEINVIESYHSIEVYGFEYEPKSSKRTHFTKDDDFTFTYHSSPSNSDLDFDIQDAILCPSSKLSSIQKFSAVVD